MLYLNLFLIMVICVMIIDLSGFINSLKKFVSLLLTGWRVAKTDYDLKPISCSYCMNFYIGLGYIIYNQQFSILSLFYVLLMSTLTIPTANIINLTVGAINTLLSKIQRKL